MRPPFLLKSDSMQFFLLQSSLLNLVQGFDNISDHSQYYIVGVSSVSADQLVSEGQASVSFLELLGLDS